jgi:tRNA (uracil-5-)-methyltransferase TRM9
MTQKTIDILNNLNKQFYDETGSVVWNQKPDYYWEGWYQLTKFISEKLKVKSEKMQVRLSNERHSGGLSQEPDAGMRNRSILNPLNERKNESLAPNYNLSQKDENNLTNNEDRVASAALNAASLNYKILDLGCGNARFANFINSQLTLDEIEKVEYFGVDFSVNFLEQSQSALQQNFPNYGLKQLDILKDIEQLATQKYDLIVMFGLIHHIPSLESRKIFFKKVASLLHLDGLLIFTTWQYLDTPRLVKRVIDPESETGKSVFMRLGIKKTDLEVGDNILDWVKKVFSYRYSHYFSQEEVQGHIQDNDLELIHSFVCDGRDSKRNQYYVCKFNSIC